MANRPDRQEREQTRKCIATGELCAPERLIRFALDPAGVVTPDLAGKLPGRGAWVLATRAAVVAAASKGAFGRAFKAAASLPEGVSAEAFAGAVEKGLEARALAALGLGRRAGAVVTGFEKVRAALAGGRAGALVTASDAGDDGAEKLARLAGKAPIVRAFASEALSAALGRDGVVVHAAALEGPECARFLRETARLEGFRPDFAAAPIGAGAA